jgi:hypothetical protein
MYFCSCSIYGMRFCCQLLFDISYNLSQCFIDCLENIACDCDCDCDFDD